MSLGEGAVTIERSKSEIIATSVVPFFKRHLKYLTKKYLKKNNLYDWLHGVANSKESYELHYFQINQDEEEEDENSVILGGGAFLVAQWLKNPPSDVGDMSSNLGPRRSHVPRSNY